MTAMRPINTLWIRVTFYHKYNTYKKFLIDVAYELCGFFNGTLRNPIGPVMVENFDHFDRNFELKCPFEGLLNVGGEHLNVSDIKFPLLLAGTVSRWLNDVVGAKWTAYWFRTNLFSDFGYSGVVLMWLALLTWKQLQMSYIIILVQDGVIADSMLLSTSTIYISLSCIWFLICYCINKVEFWRK